VSPTSQRSLSSPLPRLTAVLLCCVLSFTAPFDLSAVAEVIDEDLPLAPGGSMLVENEEPVDWTEDLLRAARSNDTRRDERKLACPHLIVPTICWSRFSLPHSDLPLSSSGGENANRNGYGGPLLC
jgi:hypothetical protein